MQQGALLLAFVAVVLAIAVVCRLEMRPILVVWLVLAPQLFLSANKATIIPSNFAKAHGLSANYNINLGSLYYAQKQ